MPKKHLSQNFLSDPAILKRIIKASGAGPEDTVVEIGPGPGRLTELMCEHVGKVIAVEFDRELYGRLKSKLARFDNIELHNADAMKFPFDEIREPFRVIANIPYHITTPIIFRLLSEHKMLRSMTLTVQKEVALRVAATPKQGKTYGVLSVMVQYRGKASYKFIVRRGSFKPAPKVDSACLHIELTPKPTVSVPDEEMYFTIVRAAFSQRRKTIHNSLKELIPDIDNILKEAEVDKGARAGTLWPEDYARIARIAHGHKEQG